MRTACHNSFVGCFLLFFIFFPYHTHTHTHCFSVFLFGTYFRFLFYEEYAPFWKMMLSYKPKQMKRKRRPERNRVKATRLSPFAFIPWVFTVHGVWLDAVLGRDAHTHRHARALLSCLIRWFFSSLGGYCIGGGQWVVTSIWRAEIEAVCTC